MSDEYQINLPRSFIELFMAPGKTRPSETRDHIAARHELCEDMAQMLTEPAQARRSESGARAQEVLEGVHRGLLAEPAVLGAQEAGWVVRRLAELLGWPPLER